RLGARRKRSAEPAEEAPAALVASASPGKRPSRGALRAAEARVAERLQAAPLRRGTAGSQPARSGRWSLLHVPSVLGDDVRADERAETFARLLLARCGAVSRGFLARAQDGPHRW